MIRPSPALVTLWALCGLLLLAGGWRSATASMTGEDPRTSAGAVQMEEPEAQETGIRVPSGSLGTPLLPRLRSLLGLGVLLLAAWSISVDRRRVPWRIVLWGTALQVLFAVFILKTPVGEGLFDAVNRVVVALLGFTVDGARFVFGNLVWDNVPVGTGAVGQGAFTAMPGQVANTGAFFAFNVLPTIIFFSSLMTVLYHLGVMQVLVKGVAWVMQRSMRTSGAETLSAAGNIFVGQFATVAGGVLAAYVGMLVAHFPDIAGHLIAASVMSAPAALVVAKLIVPETGEPETAGSLEISVERPDVNVIDAAARGASEGLHLALNVGAMLLAFIALIYMFNGALGWASSMVGLGEITFEGLLGSALAPLAWLMGVPWPDAPTVGSLLGVKTVLNEFFSYFQLAAHLSGGSDLHPRSIIITTYALSGFANFSSIAIQLGGIGGIAPSRRHDLSRLGLRAMIAGSIAAFMTATVAGMIL